METPLDQGSALHKGKLFVIGAVAGACYGLAVRLLASLHSSRFDVMTLGFIFFVPFAIGCIAVYWVEARSPQSIWTWCWLPWVAVAGTLLATMAVMLEGFICVAMFAPLALVLGSVGGLLGGLAARMVRSRRTRAVTLACVAVFPFFTAGWERPAFYRFEERTVENAIDIQASPEVVWRNIERVPAIRENELPDSWTRRIGFPDPIEATLSHEGVGGVRNASFTGGLSFIETVDVWAPEQRLGFIITATNVPATTLDEHVRVGGAYFDVMHGDYRLERLNNHTIRLHLSSRHRVSTDFNWYARLWTDAVMSDLQQRILIVIKARCESPNTKYQVPTTKY